MSVKNRFESELVDFILIKLPINPCLLPDNVFVIKVSQTILVPSSNILVPGMGDLILSPKCRSCIYLV